VNRLFRPWRRRTLWPTREGWWCLLAAMALGFAAMNTANNLLYLLTSMLLGLIVVSGVLSEQSIRGLAFTIVVPDEIHAGRPTVLGARVANRKRLMSSYSITIEMVGAGGEQERDECAYLSRLEAGAERLVTWEETFPARGRQRLRGARVATRFPFGLFVKAGQVTLDSEVVVFPALIALGPDQLRGLGSIGAAARRRGRGHELYNLREYRAGDDPRLIHWRSSAKTGTLVVRELEADTSADVRVVLEGTGARDAERCERALSHAASLAVHLLRAGGGVELVGPGIFVPLARGTAQRRRVLTALALYDPAAAIAGGRRPATRGREIRLSLD
jgi:uncharacterized protein (DUF58 family)